MPRSFPHFCLFPADILVGIAWTATYLCKMQSDTFIAAEASSCIRTLRLKVRSEAYAWLNAAATEINQVWNFANETSAKAARPFVGRPRWLTAFDLDKLSAGASKCFERIGSDTIQRVNAEYATRRKQTKKTKLRWRKSFGSNRALGWLPFKAVQLKRKGNSLRLSGKTFRVFERDLLDGVTLKSGCFTQDSVGDWFLCLPVAYPVVYSSAEKDAVGLDLGLKHTVASSDGEKLEAGLFYRNIEQKIAQAQRRGHKRQAKRLHRRAARRRRDALHKFSRKLVNQYQTIVVGDVSSTRLVKTKMAKAVLDSGWGLLKTQLSYKARDAGRCVIIVSEKNTTRACSNCGALTGPAGLDMLDVRNWVCGECGGTHDRDVNAAKNILSGARCSPSVSGNESSPSAAPPSQAPRLREARISAVKAVA
jgi:IS605 OrfB family transposase